VALMYPSITGFKHAEVELIINNVVEGIFKRTQ